MPARGFPAVSLVDIIYTTVRLVWVGTRVGVETPPAVEPLHPRYGHIDGVKAICMSQIMVSELENQTEFCLLLVTGDDARASQPTGGGAALSAVGPGSSERWKHAAFAPSMASSACAGCVGLPSLPGACPLRPGAFPAETRTALACFEPGRPLCIPAPKRRDTGEGNVGGRLS